MMPLRIFKNDTQDSGIAKVKTVRIINLDKAIDILNLELTMKDGTIQEEKGSINPTFEKYFKILSDQTDVNYAYNQQVVSEKKYVHWHLYKSKPDPKNARPMPESGLPPSRCQIL